MCGRTVVFGVRYVVRQSVKIVCSHFLDLDGRASEGLKSQRNKREERECFETVDLRPVVKVTPGAVQYAVAVGRARLVRRAILADSLVKLRMRAQNYAGEPK